MAKFSKLKTHHQIFFTLIVGIAVIAFWRGAWGLMDIYILPNNDIASMTFSLIAGLVVLATTHYAVKELI
tara:strand:- start:397 stop:606 length:210 start_codon:yes stop_codon:yes gene_type:complete